MKEEELTRAVLRYLNDTADNYAIMITGPWGCGKTYYVEHSLRKTLKEKDWSMARVSMFGIASTDDFYDRLLSSVFSLHPSDNLPTNEEAVLPASLEKATKSAKESAKRVGGTIKDLSFSAVQTFLKKYDIQLNVAAKSITELFLGSKTVLILDDLERCLLNETQMLGLIDSMVEAQGKKLVLLANEDELMNKTRNSEMGLSGESSYLAVKEKLVWQTYPFDPDLDATLRTLFHERVSRLVGDSEDATNRVLAQYHAVLRSYDEQNIRIIRRSMSICEVLEELEFFIGAQSDVYLQAALAGLLDLSVYVSRASFTSKSASDQEESARKPYADTFMEASREARLEIAPFVKDYLVYGRIREPETIVAELTKFVSAYYPNDELAQKAIGAISKWQHRTFQNSDAASIVFDIRRSLISPTDGGLSFDRYREAIEVLEDLQARVPNQHIDMPAVIASMKEAIDSDSEAALESVESGTISWQTAGFPESMKRIAVIDDLREYICQKSLFSNIEAVRAVLDDPDVFRPSKIIEIIGSEHGLTRCAHVLISIDTSLAAARLPECSNEEIHTVHRAILSTKLKAMLHIDMSERVREWLATFGEALDPSATDEVANRDVLEYIRRISLEMAGVLQSEQ